MLLPLYVSECAHLLLAHNAPVKVKNAQGWSPLAEAISYGDRQMSKQNKWFLLIYIIERWSDALEIFSIYCNFLYYEKFAITYKLTYELFMILYI